MQKAVFILILISSVLGACKQDRKNTGEQQDTDLHASPKQLTGNWIAMDFCARANQYGSVLQAMNNAHLPYAYAITFDPARPDSAICDNGMETWSLAVKYNVDTLELVNARPGKSVFLIYNSEGDKDMTMFDVTTGTAQMDRFIRSKADTKSGKTAFLIALNHNVLDGVFTSASKGVTGDVLFASAGTIQGLKDFDRYELCVAGDCFVTGDAIDVITLSNSKQEGSEKMFGYRFDGQNQTLSLFQLINKNPEEKGAYAVGAEVFRFTRKKADKK